MESNRQPFDAPSVDGISGAAKGVDAASAFLRLLIPFPGAAGVEPLLPLAAHGRPAPQADIVAGTAAAAAEPVESIVAQAAAILDEEMARGLLAARGDASQRGSRTGGPAVLGRLQEVVDGLSALWPSLQGRPLAAAPTSTSTSGPALATLRPRGPAAPGQRLDISMTLRNRESRAVTLVPAVTDLLGSRGGRIAGAQLEFVPAEVTLQPQEQRALVISMTVPLDTVPGCYAGLLVVRGGDDLLALLAIDVDSAAPRSTTGALAADVVSSFQGSQTRTPPLQAERSAAPAEGLLLQEAARLARDGELGNSDAIQLLQMAMRPAEVEAVIQRFDRQLTREARSKLTLGAFVPIPAGVDNQRYEPIFDRHPLSGKTYVTGSGTRVLNEVQFYNGEMVQLHGACSNVAAVRAVLAGSGYKPVTMHQADGSERAVVQVWLNRLTDTSLQPYDSMFIIIAAARADAPAAQACLRADENGASSALAMFDGSFDPARRTYENRSQLYFFRLLDSTQIAIDVGRERMGTDKRRGRIEFSSSGRQRTFSAWNGLGHAVAQVEFVPPDDASSYAAALAQAAATAGVPLRELPPGTEYVYPVVARIGDGPIVQWQWRTDVVPRHQSVRPDMVHFDANSEEGNTLIGWGFEPTVLGYIPNVRGVATGLG